MAFAELVAGPAAPDPGPRDLPAVATEGFSSAFKSEKLSDVLINLDRLSKLTDPLITYKM